MKNLLMALLLALAAQASPLEGSWTFDPYLSDHPEQIARVLRLATGRLDPSDVPADAVLQGEWRPERPRVHEPIKDADQRVLDELTVPVQFPPRRLAISQNGALITIDASPSAAATLTTDGKGEKLPLRAGTVTRRAQWQGPQLVVSYTLDHGGVLTYRYSIAPTTGQLVIRVTFDRAREVPSPYEIKLIYNLTS